MTKEPTTGGVIGKKLRDALEHASGILYSLALEISSEKGRKAEANKLFDVCAYLDAATKREAVGLRALGEYYGITSDLVGNGCEHGFKPAKSCPNVDCVAKLAHIEWDTAIQIEDHQPDKE